MDKSKVVNVVVVLVVVAVVAGVAWFKGRGGEPAVTAQPDAASAHNAAQPKVPEAGGATEAAAEGQEAARALPRMIDLGADKCIPCKKMAPILKELRVTYAGRAEIDFIDVWKNSSAGQLYGIRTIPTQIFYDREGNEVWRHEGFLSKEAIEAKLKELGA